jgi:maleylpyruvate isomerase
MSLHLVTTRSWAETGTALFLDTLAGMSDTDVEAPTALSGWTGRHLVAHVHHNAEALRRLVRWAATGVETRMYAGPEQRAAEIDAGAQRPVSELRALVAESAAQLAKDLDALDEEAWHSQVVTAQGRTVAAREIPWLRSREVFVHAVDLGRGIGFDAFPADFNAALVRDIASLRLSAGEGAVLTAWLTGRTSGAPDLGRWL